MAILADNRTPYHPYMPSPLPPPAPPPTPPELKKAAPAQANASIRQMTSEQQAQLKNDVEAMPIGERTDFLNDLAAKLEPSELVKLEVVFGKSEVKDAVETRSPAQVREEYSDLSAGKPPASPATVSNLSVDRQVSLAQRDYEDQVRHIDRHASTHQLTELAMAHHNDQAYLAELAKLSREGGELKRAVGVGTDTSLFQKGPSGTYNNFEWGPEAKGAARREAFANMVRAGLDRGTLNEADIRNDAAANPGWIDVAGRIGLVQVGRTDAAGQVSGKVHELWDAHEKAQAEASRLDTELGTMLAQAGPLSPRQKVKFVEAYRNDPEHKRIYDKKLETSQPLNDYLANNRDAVLDAAIRDPKIAKEVHDSVVALAGTHGVTALNYLADMQRAPTSALGAAFSKFDDLNGSPLSSASSAAMAELMAKNNGSVSAAKTEFIDLVGSMAQGIPAWGGYKDFKAGQDMLDAFAKGDYTQTNIYLKVYNDAPPVMRILAGGGVVAGAAFAAKSGKEGDYINAVNGFAQSGDNGARLVYGALAGLAESGRMAQHAGKFAGVAGFAAKLAPGLGLLANSASAVNSFNKAKEGNAGYGVALAGDVIGVVGNALECFPTPPTQIAGTIVAGVGAIVSGLGSVAGEMIEDRDRRKEMRGLLEKAGVDSSVTDEMIERSSKLHELANDLGMTPEQVQSLIRSQPGIVESSGRMSGFIDAAKAFGLSGSEVQPFAEKLAQGRPDFEKTLSALRSLENASPGELYYPQLRRAIGMGFPAASEYARQQSRELYSRAAG